VIDQFTKIALVLMVAITLTFCAFAYIGHLSGAEMEGTDAIVEDTAASTANVEATGVMPAITDVIGEPPGFTLAGIVAGLIVGYYWTEMFRRREDA